MGIAILLGGIIGLERELRDHPAGIRTHILLILGAVLYAEISRGYSGGDPSRVTAQIVTGVGFLCAGTILRTGTDVKGLTTAASLWATSAIGVAVSLGGPFMMVAVVATLFSLVTLSGVAKLEQRFFPQSQTHLLTLVLEKSGEPSHGAGTDPFGSGSNDQGHRGQVQGTRLHHRSQGAGRGRAASFPNSLPWRA